MRTIGFGGLFLIVAGCATPQAPVATGYPVSYQKKIEVPHHWDMLAQDVVDQTRQSLERYDYLAGQPIFLPSPKPSTDFGEAFRNLLISRFVNSGYIVSREPARAVVLDFDTQVVRAPVAEVWPGYVAGSEGSSSAQLVKPTNTELIVTTSITGHDGRFLMRYSNIYYIDESEAGQYVPSGPSMKYMEVVEQ